jgi:putative transposase
MNTHACRSSHPPASPTAYIPSMSHTHAWVLTHCVFSTQGRLDLIPDVSEMCKYLTGIAHAKGITLLAAGGTANHIHLLIALPPTVALSKVMQDFKGNSSHWQNKTGNKFAWQEGFGAFGVSQSQKQVVANYIAQQAEHHRKWTFEQEFMTLLRKSGVTIDRQRVFG